MKLEYDDKVDIDELNEFIKKGYQIIEITANSCDESGGNWPSTTIFIELQRGGEQ